MVKAVPQGLHTVTPQLNIDGCAEAIEVYKRAFGAELVDKAPDPSGKKIWHASIQIGDSRLFVNDVFPEMGSKGSNASTWLYVDNVDAMFKRAEAAGMTVTMPLADMFWGDRMGALRDKWGNTWNLAQHMRDMTPEEMQKAQDAFVAAQGGRKPTK